MQRDARGFTVVQQGTTWVALYLCERGFSTLFFLEVPLAEVCTWHNRADDAFAFPAGKKGILKTSHTVQAGCSGPDFTK